MEFGPRLREKNNVIKQALQKEVVTPIEARNAVEGCYCVTHYEYVQSQAAKVDLNTTEESLITAMEHLYRKTFTRLGLDFDNPTAEGLLQVLEFLDRDLGWARLNADLHEHHDQICRKVIARTQSA